MRRKGGRKSERGRGRGDRKEEKRKEAETGGGEGERKEGVENCVLECGWSNE